MIELPEVPSVRVVADLAAWTECPLVKVIVPVAVVAARGSIMEGRRCMAVFTGRCGVETQEGELGEIVIEEDTCAPTRFLMALRAFLALLSLVDVILQVARLTVRTELRLADRAGVASGTRNLLVQSPQRKIGCVVIEPEPVPAVWRVARVARAPEASLVLIVGAVARVAACLQLNFVRIGGMTALALHSLVRAHEREVRVSVVVERHHRPCAAGVTILALATETTRVSVVEPMAGVAVHRSLFELLTGMAEAARDLSVPTDEPKTCLVMIESDPCPGLRVVAVLTLIAEVPVVWVLLSVAVHTVGHGIAMKVLGRVAFGAGHALVATDQSEVCEVVIECVWV